MAADHAHADGVRGLRGDPAGARPPGALPHEPSALARALDGVCRGTGGERRYELFVPPNGAERSRALVVMLHGCTQDAADLARGTRMNAVAARRGWLVLWPEQPATANAQKCWNWYLPAHRQRDAGEPALLAGMIREVVARYEVDASRVFLAGVSAGAAMASALAVAYPELFAGLALHSGVPWGAASSVVDALALLSRGESHARALGVRAFEAMGARARPIPTLVLHGGADTVVHPANGARSAEQWATTNALALSARDGLAEPRAEDIDRGDGGYACDRRRWRDRHGRTLVERWEVRELGHAWSGGDPSGSFTDPRGPDASTLIADFFDRATLEWAAPTPPVVERERTTP